MWLYPEFGHSWSVECTECNSAGILIEEKLQCFNVT